MTPAQDRTLLFNDSDVSQRFMTNVAELQDEAHTTDLTN